ncbi:WYL domain-containing protein [Nocardioides baekrokdamisoli]|uniref:WYL domain-containing protein n=1 Tax=Nocardioides baekrokdamisoli TaxID=1804624 RepID=A0A3G9IIT1_9ACTN|nr:WYL domain-containing protein [Nocardioides baekrokdamisoli]BBH15955.1 WYL domain-containing protein [Nocardioides baekrokdamisoli]
MSAAKTERLMNLFIALLVARHPVPKERLREWFYADSSSDAAFEKTFERDKEELRSLGVPIEVASLDGYFEDEVGYRIRSEAAQLADVDLTPDEAAVVGLATRVWEQATMADAATEAVRKLQAAGVQVDTSAVDIAPPRVRADEPEFEVFLNAAHERREISFSYRGPRDPEAKPRRLQAYGVVRYSGRWYVAGYDLDRAASRIFRLSRVVGEAKAVGPAGAYEAFDVDLKAIARELAPRPSNVEAAVLARAGSGHALRRWATSVEAGVTGPDADTTWDRLTITAVSGDLVGEILACGADVLVEGPEGLRTVVVERLQAVGA